MRGIDIRDWHQGNTDARGCLILSSRLLLSLVYRLPEESEFKTYAAPPFGRDGHWPELKKMVASLHNSSAEYIAGRIASMTDTERSYPMFRDPRELLEEHAEQDAEFEFQEEEFEKILAGFD